jgi:hypothetical protein
MTAPDIETINSFGFVRHITVLKSKISLKTYQRDIASQIMKSFKIDACSPSPTALTKIMMAKKKAFSHLLLFASTSTLTTILILLAYSPTLFNFLLIDDFYYLTWLKEASNHPALLLQAFCYHFMNNPHFYRPLPRLIWEVEYLMYGANGLLLRLCSITLMLLTSLILALLTSEIVKGFKTKSLSTKKMQFIWPIFSAVLFAAYPLHCEPVNWFAAQYDILVSLFCLISFWYFIKWQRLNSKLFFILSLLTFTLGLLTKEMAVTFPLVLFTYCLLLANHEQLSWTGVKQSLLIMSPYLIVTIGYFFLRKVILGEFIGQINAYCDGYSSGYLAMLHVWWRSLQWIMVPVSTSAIPKHGLPSMTWQLGMIFALLLSIYAARKSSNKRLLFFLSLWFILSLIPAYQLFAIDSTLGGSRVAYLATIPLCMFATYGLACFSQASKYAPLAFTTYGAILSLAILILYCNNTAYAYSGYVSNNIISELRKVYGHSDDEPLKILNLPFAVGPVQELTQKPFIQRNIQNCSSLFACDQPFPFGCLKNLSCSEQNKTQLLYWDEMKQRLRPTFPYSAIPPRKELPFPKYRTCWTGEEIQTIVHLGTRSPGTLAMENREPHLVSNRRSYLELNLANFPCWPIDFICLKVIINTKPENRYPRQLDLRFTNSIVTNCDWLKPMAPDSFARIQVLPTGTEQDLIFPLRNYACWSLGNRCKGLKLLLPPHIDIKLISISLPKTNCMIPIISVPAYVILDHDKRKRTFSYDAGNIKGCTKVVLEILRSGDFFQTLYSKNADKNVILNIMGNQPRGNLEIKLSDFSASGYYEARIRALDTRGKQVGLASDHFIIFTDK